MLLEVLVCILIFSFGLLGIVGLHARALQYSAASEDRTKAAMMADELVTAMWSAGTQSLPTATITAWQNRLQASTLPSATGNCGTTTTPITCIIDGSGNVTITVTWTPPATGQTNQYITKLAMP